jgi:hypothetical protein
MGNLEVRQKLGKNWADEVKVWTDWYRSGAVDGGSSLEYGKYAAAIPMGSGSQTI